MFNKAIDTNKIIDIYHLLLTKWNSPYKIGLTNNNIRVYRINKHGENIWDLILGDIDTDDRWSHVNPFII